MRTLNGCIRAAVATLLAAAALVPPAAAAQAAATAPAAPVYALLSLIGDRLDVVVRRTHVGTLVDNNLRTQVPINEPVFDTNAVAAAARAIQRAHPKAELAAINTRSALLFDKQRSLFTIDNEQLTMPDAIRNAIRDQGATRLVFIAKHRDDAHFTFATGTSDGAGKLEGLGFYLDSTWETSTFDETTGRNMIGKGFIAPYAYISVTLTDFPAGKVLARKLINASFMAGAGRAEKDIGEPWSALTPNEKVRLVNRLVEREVEAATKELLAKAP